MRASPAALRIARVRSHSSVCGSFCPWTSLTARSSGFAGELFDDLTRGVDHQRAALGQAGDGSAQSGDEQREQRQEQQQVQHPAQHVQSVPRALKKPSR